MVRNYSKVAAREIFNALNIEVEVGKLESTYKEVVTKKKVSTSLIGPMALMIEELFVSVKAAKNAQDERTYLIFEFTYKHPGGGSNGFSAHKNFETEMDWA